jgi:lipopolysaccharide heptosyltransferase I
MPRSTPLRDYPARRIAFIKPSALGDIIHSLPVLTALRHRYPDAHITWVVNRGYAPLLEGHRDLNDVLPFDRKLARGGLLGRLKNYGRFVNDLRSRQFDLVIDLQGLFRSGLMTLASGAPRRVGLSTSREGARWFYTDVVPVADFNAVHAVERCWLVAEAFGVGNLRKEFRVPVRNEARAWAGKTLHNYPRPWLVLGVASRWPTKRWPPEHFAALARRAQERFGGTAVFVGGHDETHLSQQTATLLTGPTLDLTGRTDLPRLTAVLERSDVMLANDTGPLHLAVALGRPVVAPYTCTKIRLNGPFGQDANAVESTVWCQGSYLKKCRRLECMTELTPERLWPVLERELLTWQRKCA